MGGHPSTGYARSTATNRGTTNCAPKPSITVALPCTPTLRTIQGCSRDEHARQRTSVNAITTRREKHEQKTWPLAALLMVAPGHERRPCGSPPPHRAESLPDHRRPRQRSPWSTRGSLVLRQAAVTARCEALALSRERGAARRADRERALAVSCLSQSTARGLRIAPTIGARKGRIMANPAPSHRRFAGLRRWTAGPTHRSP